MKRVFYIRKLPFGKNFLAITLGEFILSVAPLNKYELNHELIHVHQQRELLYIPFFIWYVVEWLVLLAKYRDMEKAYFNIRFEMIQRFFIVRSTPSPASRVRHQPSRRDGRQAVRGA